MPLGIDGQARRKMQSSALYFAAEGLYYGPLPLGIDVVFRNWRNTTKVVDAIGEESCRIVAEVRGSL